MGAVLYAKMAWAREMLDILCDAINARKALASPEGYIELRIPCVRICDDLHAAAEIFYDGLTFFQKDDQSHLKSNCLILYLRFISI